MCSEVHASTINDVIECLCSGIVGRTHIEMVVEGEKLTRGVSPSHGNESIASYGTNCSYRYDERMTNGDEFVSVEYIPSNNDGWYSIIGIHSTTTLYHHEY